MDKPKRIDFEVKPEIAEKLQAIKEYDNRSGQKEIEHLICQRYAEIATLQKVVERSGEEL
jgi:hypothetical protein